MTKKAKRGFTIRIEEGLLVDFNENLTEKEALRRLKKPGTTLIAAPGDWIPPSELEPEKLGGALRDLRGL